MLRPFAFANFANFSRSEAGTLRTVVVTVVVDFIRTTIAHKRHTSGAVCNTTVLGRVLAGAEDRELTLSAGEQTGHDLAAVVIPPDP